MVEENDTLLAAAWWECSLSASCHEVLLVSHMPRC